MDKKKAKSEEKASAGIEAEEANKPAAEAQPENGQTQPENGQAQVQKSETELALDKAVEDAKEFKRKWYLVTAEYENYRRRTAAESAQRYREGRADVVKGLFPIGDDLERACNACDDEKTKKGIQMVLASFSKLLESEKITAIDPLGEPFDAEKHEAILAVEPEEGEESGIVKQVYLKGYEQNGKVLRFAQVVVVK